MVLADYLSYFLLTLAVAEPINILKRNWKVSLSIDLWSDQVFSCLGKGTMVADSRWKFEDLGFSVGKFGRAREHQALSRSKRFGQKRASKNHTRGRKGTGGKAYWRARVFHLACGHRVHPDSAFYLNPTRIRKMGSGALFSLTMLVWHLLHHLLSRTCCHSSHKEPQLLPLPLRALPTTTFTSSKHSIPLVHTLILLCILFLHTHTHMHMERIKRNQWRISGQWNDG